MHYKACDIITIKIGSIKLHDLRAYSYKTKMKMSTLEKEYMCMCVCVCVYSVYLRKQVKKMEVS